MRLSQLSLMGAIVVASLSTSAEAQEETQAKGVQWAQKYKDAGGLSSYEWDEGCVHKVLMMSAYEASSWEWPGSPEKRSEIYIVYQSFDRCSPPLVRSMVLSGKVQQPVATSKQLTSMEENVDMLLKGRSCELNGMSGPCVNRSAQLTATISWVGTGEITTMETHDTEHYQDGVAHYDFLRRTRTATATLSGTLGDEVLEVTNQDATLNYSEQSNVFIAF